MKDLFFIVLKCTLRVIRMKYQVTFALTLKLHIKKNFFHVFQGFIQTYLITRNKSIITYNRFFLGNNVLVEPITFFLLPKKSNYHLNVDYFILAEKKKEQQKNEDKIKIK